VVEWQNLIEQARNFYLQHGCFPATYEQVQSVPVLKAGILPYAGDDGLELGQAYHLSYDLEQQRLTLVLRTPDAQGVWARTWRGHTVQLPLPDLVVACVRAGSH
jgi:putative transposase